jgi:hypothetical protein
MILGPAEMNEAWIEKPNRVTVSPLVGAVNEIVNVSENELTGEKLILPETVVA